MADFLKSLKIGGRSEGKEVVHVLRRIDRQKIPILMEIEQSHIHFRSVLALKKGVVVVAKPDGLGPHLKKDNVVRFTVPDEAGQDLRLEVISPHFNLTSGNAVFLCRVPDAFAEGSKRRSVRFNTSRFNNLHIQLMQLKESYRVVDLSLNGCKLFTQHPHVEQTFRIGVPLAPAKIVISKFEADLKSVIPRVHKGNTVGCEITYPPNSPAHKYIDHLLTSLLKSEEERLRGSQL